MSRLWSLKVPLPYSSLARQSPSRAHLAILRVSPFLEQRRHRSAAPIDHHIERGELYRPQDGRNAKSTSSTHTHRRDRRNDDQRERSQSICIGTVTILTV